ncbi:MAG: SDR family NAD(P)-dependent oxidoreductase [Acidobacteriota bacterium]
MTNKALVTGGCGFIGSHIVELLLKNGWSVSVLDNLSSGSLENIKDFRSDIELLIGDVRDEEILNNALKDVKTVFHQAAFISVPESELDPAECYDVNIGGTIKIAKIAYKKGVEKIVFASSCAVYGDNKKIPLSENDTLNPLSPYAYSKMAGEAILKEISQKTKINISVLRYFNIYGPRQNPNGRYAAVISKFISDSLKRKKITIEGSGEQTRDFTFVKDVANANLLAANFFKKNYEIFNICSSIETTINCLAEEVSKLTNGVEIVYVNGRKNDIQRSCGSVKKAQDLLGFEPSVKIREGLKLTFNNFKEREENEEK